MSASFQPPGGFTSCTMVSIFCSALLWKSCSIVSRFECIIFQCRVELAGVGALALVEEPRSEVSRLQVPLELRVGQKARIIHPDGRLGLTSGRKLYPWRIRCASKARPAFKKFCLANDDCHDTNLVYGAGGRERSISGLMDRRYFRDNTLILPTFDEID